MMSWVFYFFWVFLLFHASVQGAIMLILTRRVGETLMIGDEVSVTVLGVKGNQVRLGVNAPKDIAVHREEIYQRIQHERSMQAHMSHLEQGNFAPPSFDDDDYFNR